MPSPDDQPSHLFGYRAFVVQFDTRTKVERGQASTCWSSRPWPSVLTQRSRWCEYVGRTASNWWAMMAMGTHCIDLHHFFPGQDSVIVEPG